MTRSQVPPFPNTICWHSTLRETVLNPIALDVPIEIFRATHYPSLLRWEGATIRALVRVSEQDVLDDFLDARHNHVFNVAVGDSGTGKSHFVRWMHLEIERRTKNDGINRCIREIPRSSANLADVLRRILKDFGGDVTRRLREELESHRGLSEVEVRQRVLDELAIAIEALQGLPNEDEIIEYVRSSLPALLRDQAIRNDLCNRPGGIVQQLARHVLGRRDADAQGPLKWDPSDLAFRAAIAAKSGELARGLASEMLTDDLMRSAACSVLQSVQGSALAALLRFRSGDLKRALEEIRQQLAQQNTELILLIEDLSITEGIDGELLEALQVRTKDTGTVLCTLRSIIGITNEDHERMRENIKGRVLRTLHFDAPLGTGSQESENGMLADFAAGYLNAARLNPGELEAWDKSQNQNPPPNACNDCSNRARCHRAFGAVDGRGLYPFTERMLGRLYRQAIRGGSRDRAFNPRLLMRRVLSMTLEEAERSIPQGQFPSQNLVDSFGLAATSADLEVALKRQLGRDAERTRRAIEVYAEQPSIQRPEIPGGIASAFTIQALSWAPATVEDPGKHLPPPPPPPPDSPPQLDEFDKWLRGDNVADGDLNRWRLQVHEAVLATIDWDTEGLAPLKSSFKSASIYINGQFTAMKGQTNLEVTRSAEVAIALRILSYPSTRKGGDAAMRLRMTRTIVEQWAVAIRKNLTLNYLPPPGIDPHVLGIQVLVIGAFLRGEVGQALTDAEVLDEALNPKATWSTDRTSERGNAWTALFRAYDKLGPKVQKLVQHGLACTKGGDIGTFIDPSSVLDALHKVRTNPVIDAPPNEPASWSNYKDVADLARAVQLHLQQALAEEVESAEAWRTKVKNLIGDDNLSMTLGWLKEAREAAEGVGHTSVPLRGALEQLEVRVDQSLVTATGAIDTKDSAVRLNAVGKMNRPLMKQIEKCLELADTLFSDWSTKMQKQIQDAHGGTDVTQLAQEIQSMLSTIARDYDSLLQTGAET